MFYESCGLEGQNRVGGSGSALGSETIRVLENVTKAWVYCVTGCVGVIDRQRQLPIPVVLSSLVLGNWCMYLYDGSALHDRSTESPWGEVGSIGYLSLSVTTHESFGGGS